MPVADAQQLIWTDPPAGRSSWIVLLLAGGGYGHVAVDKEAKPAARWLADRGVSSAILDYRVAPNQHPVPVDDALAAYDRLRAIPGSRVIVWGFSAGGHLAGHMAAVTQTRPELLVLTYPVVSLRTDDGHLGSARNLLGADASEDLRNWLSLDSLVDGAMPPTFIVHGGADRAVPPEHSIVLWQSLRRAGVPVELHVFEAGGHGGGLDEGNGLVRWTERLHDWLSLHGAMATRQ